MALKRVQLYGCSAQYGAFWKVTPVTMTSAADRNSSIDGLQKQLDQQLHMTSADRKPKLTTQLG